MAEPEAGTITVEQAVLLLMLENASELRQLERAGKLTPIAKDRYWLKELVQAYVRHQRDTKHEVGTQTIAAALQLTSSRLAQISRESWFKEVKRNHWDWRDVVNGFVRYLKSDERKANKGDTRIRDAKAQEIEIRTMQRLGRLIPLEVYEEMIDNIAGMTRSEFAGLAAASSRDLMQRRIIEREVNVRLRRIAERALAQAIRLEKVRGPDDAERPNGTGHMGGAEPDVSANGSGTGTT